MMLKDSGTHISDPSEYLPIKSQKVDINGRKQIRSESVCGKFGDMSSSPSVLEFGCFQCLCLHARVHIDIWICIFICCLVP